MSELRIVTKRRKMPDVEFIYYQYGNAEAVAALLANRGVRDVRVQYDPGLVPVLLLPSMTQTRVEDGVWLGVQNAQVIARVNDEELQAQWEDA